MFAFLFLLARIVIGSVALTKLFQIALVNTYLLRISAEACVRFETVLSKWTIFWLAVLALVVTG